MMFLLDTNVLSELRKVSVGRADANVLRWMNGVDASSFYLSVITLMELEGGILSLEYRNRGGATIRTWKTNFVLPQFAGRILPVDLEVALRCAQLHVPQSKSERDALIAATALVHGMTVVTRNVADFEPTGVPFVNPWLLH